MNRISILIILIIVFYTSVGCRVKRQSTAKLPISENISDVYKNVIEVILNDKEILKGFLYLGDCSTHKEQLPKRYRIGEFPSVKISKYVYNTISLNTDILCLPSEGTMKEDFTIHPQLSQLSTDTKKYQFLIYFSAPTEEYIECKIIKKRRTSEESFFSNTRFGKSVTVQFCLSDERIKKQKITMLTAG